MKLVDAFIGTSQSKIAGIAILVAILIVSISVLFSKEKIPVGQKIGIALLIFLVSIPSILYTLFQMTCIVTGSGGEGLEGETWWCAIYAWALVAIIIIYAILVIVLTIMSLVAERNMKETEAFYQNKDMYDTFANEMLYEKEEEKFVGESLGQDISQGVGMVTNMIPSAMKMVGISSPINTVAPSVEAFTASGSVISPSPSPSPQSFEAFSNSSMTMYDTVVDEDAQEMEPEQFRRR